MGFEEVYRYPIIYKGFYILSHEPVYLNEHMPYVNLHGHIHSKKYDSKQYVNLSVEMINYTPVLFDDIKKQFEIGESSE
jgi:calcineurin-like phosphoesterase family protein